MLLLPLLYDRIALGSAVFSVGRWAPSRLGLSVCPLQATLVADSILRPLLAAIPLVGEASAGARRLSATLLETLGSP